MPKVSRKKSKSQRLSAKKKASVSKKAGKVSVTRSKRTTAGVPDTFEVWLQNQVKLGSKYPEKKASGESLGNPVDWMEEWLKKQQALEEKEVKEEISLEAKPLPLGSTEEWLQKQVSDRLSKPEVEEVASTAESEAKENVEVAAPAEMPSNTSTERV